MATAAGFQCGEERLLLEPGKACLSSTLPTGAVPNSSIGRCPIPVAFLVSLLS